MVDLHRHDEYSTFDGFGNPKDLAQIAKDNGLIALGSSNHGNTNGLVKHYFACREVGIKPILGSEVYFMPQFKESKVRYHLCLFAKNATGYRNLNMLLTEANATSYYYTAIVTLKLLNKYHEGLICTSACVAGYISAMIKENKIDLAVKCLKAYKQIFGDDFYIEIQPYVLHSGDTVQHDVNIQLIHLANQYNVKCILTSDSHYGRKEYFDTYTKMHEIAKHGQMAEQYRERYMPKDGDLEKRFVKMHSDDYGVARAREYAKAFRRNIRRLVDKVDEDIFEQLPKNHVVYEQGIDSEKVLWHNIIAGLKSLGKNTTEYRTRAKQEYDIICMHGFADYFLVVQDYVRFAKQKDIAVGPGRGSACNCLVAYALGITNVDSLYFGLDFTRFLRADKKKLPDIDLDFEINRRGEVIEYLVQKYSGRSARICSYGLYKVDNALNDLFKVCNVPDDAAKDIKKFVKSYVDKETNELDLSLQNNKHFAEFNQQYDNVLVHFLRLYKKVRYIGTHSAGVAIVGSDLAQYTAIEKRGGMFSCAYDLADLEAIGVIKFDMLGLKTMSEIKELETLTNTKFDYSWLNDSAVYESFREGYTEGIFQFESSTVKGILAEINCDSFRDLAVATALNRPGPLQLGMHKEYSANRADLRRAKRSAYYEQTKDTYGTVIYQEQIMRILHQCGGMPYDDIDKILKMMKGIGRRDEEVIKKLRKEYVKGAIERGSTKAQALHTFEKTLVYSFNQGHATGYSLISFIMMYYKVHYPEVFWLIKLKYADKEDKRDTYERFAIQTGNVLLLPHVNGTAGYSLNTSFGDQCIQRGLTTIKGVGNKVASAIENEVQEHGDFINRKDFLERMQGARVGNGVLNALEKAGALEFNRKKYLAAVEKYNRMVYNQGIRGN